MSFTRRSSKKNKNCTWRCVKMKKTLVGLLVISALVSLPFMLMASDLPEGAPPNAVKPDNGQCPVGYHQIRYSMGFISMQLCVPAGGNNGPTPPPNGGQTPPPPPPPNHDQPQPPDHGHGSSGGNAPALGAPPSVPNNPQGYSQPPRDEKNRALQEKPKDLGSHKFAAVARNNLYFYYGGRYTSTAATYMGRWLPVYVKLPRGGNLRVQEQYYSSGRVKNYNWGYRPAGWTKFWFYADTRGWHALISNTNGAWGNWIWVYVY